MEILVYDPRYVNQNEVFRIMAEMKEKGAEVFCIVHMNKEFRPFYIESTSSEAQNERTGSKSNG